MQATKSKNDLFFVLPPRAQLMVRCRRGQQQLELIHREDPLLAERFSTGHASQHRAFCVADVGPDSDSARASAGNKRSQQQTFLQHSRLGSRRTR